MDFKNPAQISLTVLVARAPKLITVTNEDGTKTDSYVVKVMRVNPITLLTVGHELETVYVSAAIGKHIVDRKVYDIDGEYNEAGITGHVDKVTGFAKIHSTTGIRANLWTPVGGSTLKGSMETKSMADVIAKDIAAQIAAEEKAAAEELVNQQ